MLCCSGPKGVEGAVPVVLEVHGGPARQVEWQYHHFKQFLINRGFAVLAVNFRGSSSFIKTYQAAGYGKYGRNRLDDLVDATQWATNQGIANAEAIAINGGSCGGYASAMGLLRDPSLFKAGINEHAVLYVAYQSQNPPHSQGLYLRLWELYFTDKACPRLSAHRNRTAHRARRDATGCFVAQAQKGLKALFLWCLKCTAGLRAK